MGQIPSAGGTPGVTLRILKLLDRDLSQPNRVQEAAAKIADPTELLGRKKRPERLLSLLRLKELAGFGGRLSVDCSRSASQLARRELAAVRQDFAIVRSTLTIHALRDSGYNQVVQRAPR